MGKETKHEPCTVALVRDVHQRGGYSEILNPVVRPDGWLQDPVQLQWYSPSNVLSVTTFTPRKWDGNGLKPGTLCQVDVWKGVTSERPSGYDTELVVVVKRSASWRLYEVMSSALGLLKVAERQIVPVLDAPDAQA
jgi:hypothetical protein